MVGCCAYGCTNSTGKGFVMKRFPSNPERRKIWAIEVNRENWTPTDSSRLCEAHFRPDMFEQNRADGKRKLRWNAVPTIFPPPKKPWLHPPRRSQLKKCESKRPAIDYLSEDPDVKNTYNTTYYDEEENCETSKSTGFAIKVEPGLTGDMYQDDEPEEHWHFLAGFGRLKQEPNPDSMVQEQHLGSMINVNETTYIKQEDESWMNSPHSGVKIKMEPGLDEDNVSHDCVS